MCFKVQNIMLRNKRIFSFDMSYLDNVYAIWFSAIWLMTILAIVKLLYIFLVTMRGVALSWPFDSYLFDPFHRFTDWLIPYRWSEETNPWKKNHPLLANLPPSPYGPITFAYLRAGHIVGSLASFFLAFFAFLYLTYRVFLTSLPVNDQNRRFLAVFLFTVLLLVFYPIHLVIDRGNADIIPAIFIAGVFLVLVYSSNQKASLDVNYSSVVIDLLLVLAACSKPSWLPLLALTVVSGSLKRIGLVIIATMLIYSLPFIFQGVTIADYVTSIKGAYKILVGVSAFSHNFANGVRPFIEGPNVTVETIVRGVFLFGAVYSCATLALCFYLRKKAEGINKANCDILIFIHIIICVLLFNHPSPDYRLVVLLPALAAILVFWEKSKAILRQEYFRVRSHVLIIVFAFSVSASWANFYMPSGFSIFAPVRAWLLILVDVVSLILFWRVVALVDNRQHERVYSVTGDEIHEA